jgi:hypothetical protein
LSQRGTCKTDKEGKFNLALQDFQGQANLILQTKDDGKLKEKNILLDRNFSPELKSYSFTETNIPDLSKAVRDTVISKEMLKDISDLNKTNLSMSEKNHLLQEITVKAKKKNNEYAPVKVNVEYKVEKELDKMIDKGDWMPADIFLFLEKMNKYYNSSTGKYKGKNVMFVKDNSMQLISGINAILSGVDNFQSSDFSTSNANQFMNNNPTNSPAGNSTTVSSNPSATNNAADFDNQASILPRLDEIESASLIEDFNSIIRIDPRIDPTTTVLIILHTKKNYQNVPAGIRDTKFDGYAHVKEFYSPRYDKAMLPNEKDYRRTLYWNPDVKTDQTGKATISFFNNSSCKSMNVNAETVTSNGIIGVLNK